MNNDLSIEQVDTCQQKLYKIKTKETTFYKKHIINNHSWYTFNNDDIYSRIKNAYDVLQKNDIGCPNAKFDDDNKIVIMDEVKGIHLSESKNINHWYKCGVMLNKLHKTGYIHGDFHQENIFIDSNDNIIFIDFEEFISQNIADSLYDLTELYINTMYKDENMSKYYYSFLKGYGLNECFVLGIKYNIDKIRTRNKNYIKWCKCNNIDPILIS